MMVEVDFIDGSFLAGGPGGNVNLITYEGELEQIELPSNLTPIRERVSFASMRKGDISRLFTAGGLTGNGMFTEQRFFLRQFIQNPTQEVIESTTPSEEQIGLEQVAGSTGPTGLCVFYFRFRDSLHGRRSPFSMGSPTLNLDGTEAVRVRNFPLGPEPADICVDQIEVWVSRNGAAKRRLATRDIGTTDFTITETIEYEAETQVGLQKVPRCKYNAVWHDRLWQAGDERHPDRVYFSPPERFDEYAVSSTSAGYLVTRNGETITAMVAVRDILVIFAAKSCYWISGFSESDFEMKTLEPEIGCINHHGIRMIHDIAMVPTHQGFFACTGSAMHALSGGYSAMWTQMYSSDPQKFENGFAINDTRGKVYKFYMDDPGTFRYWVLDYQNFSQQEGGGFSAPLLSFDKVLTQPKCATMFTYPGGRAGDCYTANVTTTGLAGNIVKENVWQTGTDNEQPFDVVIQTPMCISEEGGGPNDGYRFIEGWLLAHNFDNSPETWTVEMLHGPERAAIRGDFGDQYSWALTSILGINPAAFPNGGPSTGKSIVVTPDQDQNHATFTPAVPFPINLVGEGLSLRVIVTSPKRFVWAGFGFTYDAGKRALIKYFDD